MKAMKSSIKNISIIEAGAMGAVYARMLYDMDPGSVSFVARGDRMERLRREGLIVNGKLYSITLNPAIIMRIIRL
jgi:2-dehydropantoate 2-reductase